MKGGTLSISWGDRGGVYWLNIGGVRRLCLGWVAVSYWPYDLDYLLEDLLDECDSLHAPAPSAGAPKGVS